MIITLLALAFIQEPKIVTRQEWGARPPMIQHKRHWPVKLTIHYTGVPQKPDVSLEQKLKNLQLWCQREDKLASGKTKPAWPDIPYHYYISVDGRIGECREPIYVGDTNTEYDPTGHLLVVVEADDKSEITEAEKASLRQMVVWLAKKWKIPADALGTHRDYAKTECPGNIIAGMIPELKELIDGSTED